MQYDREQKIAEELLSQNDKDFNQRVYSSKFTKILGALFVLWTIFQVYFNLFGGLDAITFRAYHAMFLLGFTFLVFPLGKEKKTRDFPPIVDMIAFVLAVGSMLYMVLNYHRVAMSGGFLTNMDLIVGGVGILVAIYGGYRASGNLAILAVIFLSFNLWGKFVPGVLGHSGFTIRRIISHMFWGSQGIFGIGIGVSATYIFLFVLFGAFLKRSGFSNFLNDLSLTLVGNSPGGPAKVAVVASALLGMINGSAVANVATTGTITIPMMKKTGYSKEFAAAVEATASTGGQFAPPIMGAVGFVMAEYLGVSYTAVMLAAIIPAFLYYLGVICSVHFEAKKLGLKGIAKENIPDAKKLLREQGHLSLPLFVLVGMMIAGFTPLYCGIVAIFATVVSSYIKEETRMSLSDIYEAIVEGASGAISVGMSCVMIGLIIGTVSLTGLGLSFGQLVLQVVGDGQLFLGGLMVMIMSTILGMGVPGVAAYIIVATVSAPVLIQSGATPIAAHLFCLIYACLSNITPPVAISSYVASGIAGSNQTKTSLIAIKLGITGFIIPFFFLDNPVMLIGTDSVHLAEIIRSFVTASVGVVCISAAMEGMLFTKLGMLPRGILLLVGFLAIDPSWQTDLAGIVLLAAVIFAQWKNRNLTGRKI